MILNEGHEDFPEEGTSEQTLEESEGGKHGDPESLHSD